MAAISAAAAANRTAFADYGDATARDVIGPLADVGLVQRTPDGSSMSSDDILALMAGTHRAAGFTMSPVRGSDDAFVVPTEGICVALPGSDLRITADMFDPDSGAPTVEARQMIDAFHEHQQSLHATGHVWLGGWRNADGEFELNATIILPEENLAEATRLGHQWRQHSVYQLSTKKEIEIGGDGGDSIYSRPKRLLSWLKRKRRQRDPE